MMNLELKLWHLTLSLVVFLLALLILTREQESRRQRTVKWTVAGGVALYAFACCLRFGETSKAVTGALFALILLYAAKSDIETYIVGNFISVEILILSFVAGDLATVPHRVILAAVALLPGWIVSRIHPKQVLGGADVKITAASIFLIGSLWGFAGYALGLLLGAIWSVARRKTQESFPLVPFLAVGFLTAFLI